MMEDAALHADTIREAAKLLSDDPADCEALIPALVRAADAIRAAQIEAESSPQRAAVRKKLDDLRKAATAVSKLLNDPDLNWLCRFSLAHDRGNWADTARDHMGALADDAAWARECIPTNPGTNALADVLGVPRGRHLCAVAAVKFFALARSKRPDKKNTRAQEFCALLWKAAGGRVSDAVKCGTVADTGAWERHISDVRNPANNAASSLGARLTIGDIIDDTGLRDAFPQKKADCVPSRKGGGRVS